MKIVAELSCNHHGTLEGALALVDAAKAAGAHAVKLQTWAPGKMTLTPHILRNGPWVGLDLQDLYERARTPWEWHKPIYDHAHYLGIECFSSVFDPESLAMLEILGCPRYKIASFELVDLPLIQAVARTGKPMILSTGMATYDDIQDAVGLARLNGCKDLTLLKCTSAYPADGSSANLRTMEHMRTRWEVKVGLSDHTPGIGVALVAIAMGATMIEKHLTLSRAEGGYDANFSVEPRELAQLVREARQVSQCPGEPGRYGATEHERPQLELRRSIYFTQDLPSGTVITAAHVRTARPAKGLHPRFMWRLIGGETTTAVRSGQPTSWDVITLQPLATSPTDQRRVRAS